MELFAIKHLNFAYPEQAKNAISDFSLSVQPGEFLVLCGPSGCGKSTLLRQLKTVLAPHGRRSGQILFDGKNLDELSQREQAEKIVSVMRTNVDLSGALEDAAYTPEQRAQIARAAFAQCNPAFTEVLAVMAERGEIKLLPQVRASYENQVETKLNLCILDVTTVVELDDHLRDIIKQKAESELGMKVVLRERIDKSILGGIIMSAGDKRIDASVASQLNNARIVLKKKTDGGEC